MTGLNPVKNMPAKNQVKTFVDHAYYHAYNRGVEKRDIFLDDQDYRVFLSYLRAYLSKPIDIPIHPITEVTGLNPVRERQLLSFHNEIVLISYCLMPNHFHLLLWQSESDRMTKFMQALGTSYSMYFNHRYKRVGTLFQGTYKAAYIDRDEYLLHLSRYIHRNPIGLTGFNPVSLIEYPYSSYAYYLNRKKAQWINPKPILEFFTNNKTETLAQNRLLNYEGFVEELSDEQSIAEMLKLYLIKED